MKGDMSHKETVELFKSGEHSVIEAENGSCKIALSPSMGGRIISVSWDGDSCYNPFFLNPVDVLNSKGADGLVFRGGLGARDWLGPEGCGDMTFYMSKKPIAGGRFPAKLGFWGVDDRQNLPRMTRKKDIDATTVTIGEIHMPNYRGNQFDIQLLQKVELVSNPSHALGIPLPKNVDYVGFHKTTTFTNIGKYEWNDQHGYAMQWFVLMLRSSDHSYIIAPFRKSVGKVLIDHKFDGRYIPENRLTKRTEQGYVIFNGDGNFRGKIGQSPQRSLGVVYGMDLDRDLLTILRFDVHPDASYLDNRWTQEPITRGGDVMNAYNNLGSNPALPGRFYELEAVSPRLALKPGESAALNVTAGFFHGAKKSLDKIVEANCQRNISQEDYKA